jgi:DNA-binding transcriptional MerR regulator
MRYVMSELEARSGLTSRTIRDYIKHGYLAPPTGLGPAASYSEEQLLRVVTIARMRARRADWQEILDFLNDSSLAQLRAFVRKTDPPESAAPPASASEVGPAPASSSPALEGEPARRELPPAGTRARTGVPELAGEEHLPELDDGTSFVMTNVLPGLALFLRSDASPLVKRVAAEILRKYRVR